MAAPLRRLPACALSKKPVTFSASSVFCTAAKPISKPDPVRNSAQTFRVKMIYPRVEMHVENLYLSVGNCMSLLYAMSFPQQRRLEDLRVFR
jgi:hypothetical protein